ncbi:hypothetical protein D621_00215 [beta proteobacterium AAP51]|nr:hypothetical protein D621_00215 [beta proteobacterium AAP51]
MAVMVHFATEYAGQGQTAIVTVDDKEITVQAFEAETTALDAIMPLLRAGKLAEALPLLESLNKSAPNNADVLYNLGVAYSELGQHDEAIIRLKKCVQIDPTYAHAWVGIGNAYYRLRKKEQALDAFEKAVKANPKDGYTRRNLGGMLLGSGRSQEAVEHLRQALALMPDDAQSIFGLASALEAVGTEEALEEADGLHRRVIEEHPTAPFVEQSEKARTAYSQRLLKAKSIGGFRPDVMMYISDALKTFKRLGPQGTRSLTLEIAMLGRNGLDVNDSTAKYKLKAVPGQFSGLQLLSIMYAAFQTIDPSADIGANFKAEYDAALKMQGK